MLRKDLSRDALTAYICAAASPYNLAIDFFKKAMKPNEYFKFNEVCPGFVSYDIYAIANVNGMIMAEYVLFGAKKKGDETHELGTKGLESSIALLIAMHRYAYEEGVSEIHPEYADYKPILCV